MLQYKMAKVKFKKKDEVVYPLHGVGTVEGTYDTKVNNKKAKFLKVRLKESDMSISVPLENAEKMGLRKVIKKSEIAGILKQLTIYPKKIEDNWKVRFQENIDKLKTGDIKNLANVIKELFIRNKIKTLSVMERKQYENAYHMLVKEISISDKADEEEVNNLISSKLDSLGAKFEKKMRKKNV
ncbi:MAG TPA: CarD family transcriptional regulator [Spirochaetota bacterium]|nr:CarD family transcriptional regulator [Spirochaetota bacterium]